MTGVDDYQGLTPESPLREDDVTAWGVQFSFQMTERWSLRFGYSATEWDSNLEEFDRDQGRIQLGLSFGLPEFVLGQR